MAIGRGGSVSGARGRNGMTFMTSFSEAALFA
jgi:hypothetical protein